MYAIASDPLCGSESHPRLGVRRVLQWPPHEPADVKARARAGDAISVHAPRPRHGINRLPDPAGDLIDVRGEAVDLVQQHPGQLAVVLVEPAGQRLNEAIA